MQLEEFLGSLAVWVHTCPQRAASIQPTLDSLKASDLSGCAIAVEISGANGVPYPWKQTIEWWIDRWEAMSRKAKWVLRLEDDIIVSKHIGHNLATWPALLEKDFGMGLGFVFDFAIKNLGGVGFMPNKVVFSKARGFPGGQAQLMRSDVIQEVVVALRKRMRQPGIVFNAVFFDTLITEELTNLKRRTYLHVPSLVQTNQLSDKSAASNCDRHDHHANRTWDPEWKRPESYDEEFMAEIMLKGTRTRWAVLNDGSITKCTTPVNLAPVSGPVTINGRLCGMRSSYLYDSYAEALKNQGRKLVPRQQQATTTEAPRPLLKPRIRTSERQQRIPDTEQLPAPEAVSDQLQPPKSWKRNR